MQQLENVLDPVHATILHGRPVHGFPAAPEWMEMRHFTLGRQKARPITWPGGKGRSQAQNGIARSRMCR